MSRAWLVLPFVVSALAAAAPAPAQDLPPLDRGVLKGLYDPTGFFKPGDAIPSPLMPPAPDAAGLYNPSGHWSAYDTNIYETLNYPMRQANDASDSDPLGSGDPRHGFCPPSTSQPEFNPYGRCANHSLEYINHFERTMKAVLGDFGVVFHRYPWNSGEPGPRPLPMGLSTDQGASINPAAIIPGADHPEQMVVFGAHFDQTDAGPASFWDSAEGHATMPRIAHIMAEYWRKTNTRPSATVIFIPWDQEEAGTLGSIEWLDKNIPPDSAPTKVRGYFNDDPCAAGFPAFYHGNPLVHVPVVVQLSDPATFADPERATAFNAQAARVIDEFWADVDDEVDTAAGAMPVYTDADRGELAPALGGLAAFSSDYGNFESAGVPIFNMFADILGPHADGNPGFSAEGITILHTPRDNATTWSAFTSADQTGMTASDGYMTGMEMCANLHARFMLEPNMGGATTASLDPVAYYEALPNEASLGKLVNFDAGGSHQLSSISPRKLVEDADLQFKWDFGDGTPEAFGKVVKHAYKRTGTFTSKLTVTNRDTHKADTMTLEMTVVEEGQGDESDPPGQAADPGLRAQGSLIACQSSSLDKSSVKAAGKGLEVTLGEGQVGTVEVFQFSRSKNRKVGSATINGRGTVTVKGSKSGIFFANVKLSSTNRARPDTLSFAFTRKGGSFKARKAHQLPDTCDEVSVFRLSVPAFGGKQRLRISFVLREAGRATVSVYRGSSKKAVRTFKKSAKANKLAKVTLSPGKLRSGEYRIVLKAAGVKKTLYATKT